MPALKVCGVADCASARSAALAGADFVGVIFAPESPRRATPELARRVAAAARGAGRAAPPRIVCVFTGGTAAEIAAAARAVPADVVQLHWRCPEETVRAVKAAGFETWLLDAPPDSAADAVLLDGRDGARSGGTGRTADWERARAEKRAGRRVVLAGGLSAGNIRAAAATGADVLDVNSGVETAPGVKSPRLLEETVAALRGCPVL